MTRLLIAGAGYLGSRLCRTALKHGLHVTVLARSTDALRVSGFESQVQFIECDISSTKATGILSELEPPDLVASTVSSGGGQAEAYRAAFVDGGRNLISAFPNAKVLFTSSTSVYGQTDGSEVSETSLTAPSKETGRILLEAEQMVIRSGGVVARLSGIYGPGRSVLLRRFVQGTAILEEEGHRWINQIHLEDAAEAITRLLLDDRSSGEIYNVSDGNPIRQIDLYNRLAALTGLPVPPKGPIDPTRKRAWTNKRVTTARLSDLGWSPRFSDVFAAIAETGLEALAGVSLAPKASEDPVPGESFLKEA